MADQRTPGDARGGSPKGFAEPVRFALIEFFFWASILCFEGFMVPYLSDEGYSPSRIGPIMSAVFGLAVLGQPLLGAISDRIASPKWLVGATMAIAGISVVLVPSVSRIYGAVLAIALVYSVTGNSLPAVLDGWIMARREYNPRLKYGVVRGLGSAGFATAALVLGLVTDRLGAGVVFPVYLGLAAVTAVLALTVPRVRRDGTAAADRPDPRIAEEARRPLDRTRPEHGVPSRDGCVVGVVRDHVVAVLRNRAYVLLLVSSFLAFVGFRAALTFLPLLIEELEGSLSDVGLAHSIGAISEVPFFFLSTLIFTRFRGSRFVVVTLVLLAVRLAAYSLLTSSSQVLALQVTHGLTFGLFLAATVDYIHTIAPREHRSFFQALAPSVYFGLGSIVGSWLGGIVIELSSTDWLYRGSGVLALLGAGLLMLTPRKRFRDTESSPRPTGT
jgi:predicted MFS family arabinose efflux permease